MLNRFKSVVLEGVNPKTVLILMSILVGVVAGLVAVLLKLTVKYVQKVSLYITEHTILDWGRFFLPLIGIIASVLIVKYLFNDKFTRGLSNLIFLISRKQAIVPLRKVFSHFITSAATVGFGGSVGLEAPIVIVGGAIGSNISQLFALSYRSRTLLLACGSAAGISAIFNTPIAGVIFAFEVLLPELSISSFIPLLLSSAVSSVVASFFYHDQLFYLITEGWHLYAIPFYILLGILCGLVSVYMIRVSTFIEQMAEKVKSKVVRVLVFGLSLAVIVFFVTPLFGEGYEVVESLLKRDLSFVQHLPKAGIILNSQFGLVLFLLTIILAKVVATSLTIGSGGNGGIIAPSLFTGAITGYFLAELLHSVGIIELNRGNFLVVGMAGVLAGVLHAPLTGIFLIAEITGGYALIVPLMITAAIAFFISKYFQRSSIYTSSLVPRGIEFRSEKEKLIINQMDIRSLIETDFVVLHPTTSIREVVEHIKTCTRNLFPVTDEKGVMVGMVALDDVREILLNTDVHDLILVYEIMSRKYECIEIEQGISSLLDRFEKGRMWSIPVTEHGVYLGFITKSNLFSKYLAKWSENRAEII